MAHELEIVEGQASTFSVGKTPWHELGIVAPAGTEWSYEQAMEAGKLDYPVEQRPVFLAAGDSYRESEKGQAIVRADTGRELAVVTKKYNVVQNKDAFAILKPLIDAKIGIPETGGVLRDGEDAWLMVRWNPAQLGPAGQTLFSDGQLRPYGIISTNHTGRRGITLADCVIRVVCANTHRAMLQEVGTDASVRHTKNAEVRLLERAERLWGGVIRKYETVAAEYQQLRARFLDTAMFRDLVLDPIAPLPIKVDTPLAEKQLARQTARRGELTRLWTEGMGHTGDLSAWEAFNAVTEAMDHDRAGLWPARGERVAALSDGRLQEIKAGVYHRLLSVS